MKKIVFAIVGLAVFISIACNNIKADTTAITDTSISQTSNQSPKALSEAFKKYWYAGTAEITSYKLEQARYGEMRSGTAALIYVTEDFLAKEQVKADRQKPNNIPVLKLNTTKKFNTGIYPYSIMQSTFYPVGDHQHALKISSSMQEWCGHVYTQLNNRKQFEVISHSYFEGEADQKLTLQKSILENELWSKIRIRPEELPVGKLKIIPSFEFFRLRHKEIKAYDAIASIEATENTKIYQLTYPSLDRTLRIAFNTTFPHEIEGWTETYSSGFGPNAKMLTTKATKIKRIQSAYWGKNKNKDEVLRKELGL